MKKSIAIFIGGQPGSGKTILRKTIKNDDYLIFDLDLYRKRNRMPGEYMNLVSTDAINNKKNFIMECNMDKNSVTFYRILANSHYNIFLYLMATCFEDSLLSIFERYINLSEKRLTTYDNHYKKYNSFMENLSFLNTLDIPIKVYTKTKSEPILIYDSFNGKQDLYQVFSSVNKISNEDLKERLDNINQTLGNIDNFEIKEELLKLNLYFKERKGDLK